MPKVQKPTAEPVYPDVKWRLAVGPDAITAEQAMALLKWEEVADGAGKEGSELFTDENGKRVRCLHSTKNRPFDIKWARSLGQDTLRRNQKFNGENVIIGRDAEVLSGNHRLIGLVLACQLWEKDPYWKKFWPDGPPVWETGIIYGIDESPDVVRTLDNTKPRGLDDVLITSGYFDTKPWCYQRQQLAKYLAYAVRVVWNRAGIDKNAFAPHRTNSECMEFITNHPKLVECIKHVITENSGKQQKAKKGEEEPKKVKGRLAHYCGLGTCAGLLYLMGSSASDPANYRQRLADGETPTERQLDWSSWDRACQFWVELAKQKAGKLADVYGYRQGNKLDEDTDPHSVFVFTNGSPAERVTALCKAWQLYAVGPVKADELQLEYVYDEAEGYQLKEPMPSVGGIDYGEPQDAEEADEPEEADTADDVEANKAIARAEREAKKAKAKEQQQAGITAAKETAKANKQAIKTGTADEKLEALRSEYPGALLLVQRGSNYAAYGQDATEVSSRLNLSIKLAGQTQYCEVPGASISETMKKLKNAGNKVEIVTLPGLNGKAAAAKGKKAVK